MGHIQYFLQYRDQPVIFRDGANPGKRIGLFEFSTFYTFKDQDVHGREQRATEGSPP